MADRAMVVQAAPRRQRPRRPGRARPRDAGAAVSAAPRPRSRVTGSDESVCRRPDRTGQQARAPFADHGGCGPIGHLRARRGRARPGNASSLPSAFGHSSSVRGRGTGGGAGSSRVRYRASHGAMASPQPRCASASATIGPWLARPNRPYWGAVSARAVNAWSRGSGSTVPVCRRTGRYALVTTRLDLDHLTFLRP